MSVTFNPMNPMTWWTAPMGGYAPSVFPAQKRETGPIAIDASSSDPGMKVTTSKDSITFKGETKGALRPVDEFGVPRSYEVARGMGFSLDIKTAPTTTITGETDYTKKNHRLFSIDTARGWSAIDCAERLADKVNDKNDFKATVVENRDGSATLNFTRR